MTINTTPATILISGACIAIDGIQNHRLKETVLGLSATHVGAQGLGISPGLASQIPLVAGNAINTINQFSNACKEASQGKFRQFLKGVAKTAIGCAATACFYALPPQIIEIGQKASLLGFTSLKIGQIGFNDLSKKNVKKGACELIVGALGLAGTAYYLYHELAEPLEQIKITSLINNNTIPSEISDFLKKHENEIDEMYKTEQPSGNFKKTGRGFSKIVFEHPDSNYVVKIPRSHISFWNSAKNNMIVHHENMEKARSLIKTINLDRLYVPHTILIEKPAGPFLLEEKLKFSDFQTGSKPLTPAQNQAKIQLDHFVGIGKYCDVSLEHNAQFLEDNSKIGIFDLDCEESPSVLQEEPIEQKLTLAKKIASFGPVVISLAQQATRYISGAKASKLLLGSSLLTMVGMGSYIMTEGICLSDTFGCAAITIASGVAAACLITALSVVKTCSSFLFRNKCATQTPDERLIVPNKRMRSRNRFKGKKPNTIK